MTKNERPHDPAAEPPDRPLVLMGRITGAHGIKGEVMVRAFTDAPGGVSAYGPLTDRSGARRFDLKVVRETDKGLIARLAGVDDRSAAEALKGTELYVSREQLPDAEPGSYYYRDLEGLAAVSPEGDSLGVVVGVSNFGAGDLLEVRLTGQTRTEFVPFAEPFVGDVDLAGGRVVIDMARVIPPSGQEKDDA